MRSFLPLTLGAVSVLLLAGCDSATGPDGKDRSAGTPSASVASTQRSDPWQTVTSDAMWAHVVRYDTTVTVGIKHLGAARGVVDGRWLLARDEFRGAVAALQAGNGAEVVQRDSLQPMVRLRPAGPEAIERIRRLPFVDYVEPAVLDGADASLNHAASMLAGSPGGVRLSSSGGATDPNFGHYVDAEGNWIPNIFTGMRIPEAWALSTGAGVKLGFLDTGVDYSNPELAAWRGYRVYAGDTYDDEKPHGTHVAGAIGAPRNGTYVVGVAYGITPVSVKHSNNYLDVNTWRVVAALDTAVFYGAKVINMSFRSDNTSNAVSDRLDMYYNGVRWDGSRYDVVFVAASGSGGTVAEYWIGVIFPASHPKVIAVSAIDYNTGQPYTKAQFGPEVELSAYHGQPSTGTRFEGYYNGASGNTSNASGIVAGVAALVRSRYPHLTNDQVRTTLRRGASDMGLLGRDSYYGYGVVNAYAAVGGFYESTLLGANWHDQCSATTNPNRTCLLSYTATSCFTETFRVVAHGDGPFTYRWSTGSTSDRTTMTLCPTYDYDYSLQVRVTDGLQNRTLTHTAYIRVDGGGTAHCDPNLDPRCPA
jgi:hypothetical protein